MTPLRRTLFVVAAFVAVNPLRGQADARFPTEPVPPVILPYEPGGAEVHLHTREADSKPFPAHKIIGNIHYVGLADYASYLITSDQGHILIDPTFRSTVPLIEQSITSLGFRVRDIKIILITHAHADHSEGAARMKDLSGAQLMVMDGDAQTVESGGGTMPPVKVDRVLHDGDEVRLGSTAISVRLAAGHTKGNTTFAWKTTADGKSYNVVLIGSLTSMATALRENPDLIDDYRRTIRSVKALPCDVFLAPHGKMFGLAAKHARLAAGGANPYIDPKGYRDYIDGMEKSLYYKLDWAHR